MKKLIFLFFTLLIVIYVIRSPQFGLGGKDKIKNPLTMYTETVSHNEMNNFLRVWSKYLQDDVSKIGARQVSLTMGPASEKFPIQTINWLTKEGWNADRFFYVEQRMKAIVKSAFLQEHIKSTIAMLESQAGQSGVYGQNAQRLIDEQKQRINVEKISSDEINMVTPNLVLISDILDGTKPYQYVK